MGADLKSMFTFPLLFTILIVNLTCTGNSLTDTIDGGAIAPGSFTISSATSGNNQVQLSWETAENATSYTLKYGISAGSYDTTFSTNATSPLTVTGLTNTILYYFMIEAFMNSSSTDASTEASATPNLPSFVRQLGDTAEGTLIAAGASDGWDVIEGITTDASGNIYITGYTGGSLGEPFSGVIDTVIVKYDSSGNLKWIKQLGDTAEGTLIAAGASDSTDRVNAITTDNSGNIYIGGGTQGSLGEPNGGSYDAFIIKYDSSGTFQWIKQLGDTAEGTEIAANASDGQDTVKGITTDNSGNIYLGGYTQDDLGEPNGGALNDTFIVKYNSSGTFQWIQQLGDTAEGTIIAAGAASLNDRVGGITSDSSGNIYIGGYTTGNLGETNGGGNDTFIVKYDSSGTLLWIKQLGDTAEGTIIGAGDSDGSDIVGGIATDASGNIYIGGFTYGNLGEPNGGSSDVFVAKYNSSGTLLWIKQLGDTSEGTIIAAGAADGSDEVTSVTTDASGNVYLGGFTTGSLGETNGGGGNYDAFIVKYDSNGNFQWVKQLGATAEGTVIAAGAADVDDVVNAITTDASGNIYIGGYTEGDLGETNGGGSDTFIVKFKPDGTLDPL